MCGAFNNPPALRCQREHGRVRHKEAGGRCCLKMPSQVGRLVAEEPPGSAGRAGGRSAAEAAEGVALALQSVDDASGGEGPSRVLWSAVASRTTSLKIAVVAVKLTATATGGGDSATRVF